ncbi:MAG: hypothetical protein JSW00_19305 [Thermoplasmata archaeon]|nr:MAG: hypothetical protein JSW00_19305 [Thermoplasmata archaeon]
MKKNQNKFYTVIITVLVVHVIAMGILLAIPEGEKGEEECEEGDEGHEDFEAFTLTIDAPSEVPDNYEFEYKVIVRDEWKHDVLGLSALLDLSKAPNLEFTTETTEPYHMEESSSVSLSSNSDTFLFPVEDNATEATIKVDGDEGPFEVNNIDLNVYSPDGDTAWAVGGAGANPELTLDADDLREAGYGDYRAEVHYIVGTPSISFSITIDVQYDLEKSRQSGPDLGPGDEHTFSWSLRSIAKGGNTVLVIVSGTAHHDHDDPSHPDSELYTYDASSELEVGDRYVYNPPEREWEQAISIIDIERTTGIISAVVLIVSIVLSGLYKPMRIRIEGVLKGAGNRTSWHCRISFVLILLSFVHGMLLPFSPHATTLRGLAFGSFAFFVLGALGFVGLYQKSLIARWGADNWRRLHLLLTILTVIVVIVHAASDGTDFAWLR